MALPTRQNLETDELEVFINERWVPFQEYRDQQIADAYEKIGHFFTRTIGRRRCPKSTGTISKGFIEWLIQILH